MKVNLHSDVGLSFSGRVAKEIFLWDKTQIINYLWAQVQELGNQCVMPWGDQWRWIRCCVIHCECHSYRLWDVGVASNE